MQSPKEAEICEQLAGPKKEETPRASIALHSSESAFFLVFLRFKKSNSHRSTKGMILTGQLKPIRFKLCNGLNGV
jgi:hypothetical protein